MKTIKKWQAFNELIGFCSGFGGKYNPGRQNLRIENLQAQKEAVRLVLETVKETKVHFINEVNERKQVFAQLPALTTRVLRAMDASGTSAERLTSARTLVKSILGKSKNAPAEAPKEGTPPEGATAKRSSLSKSYWSRVDAFSQLVKMIASEPRYQPNEPELSLAGLTQKLEELEIMNQRVAQARVQWSNALTQRNNELDDNENSMIGSARQVKSYLLSIFGYNSAEYEQVKGIRFN
jgi:hypothetical protein